MEKQKLELKRATGDDDTFRIKEQKSATNENHFWWIEQKKPPRRKYQILQEFVVISLGFFGFLLKAIK